LKLTKVTASFDTKVSWGTEVNADWTRRMSAAAATVWLLLTSLNTIQPFCHEVPLAHAVAPVLAGHTVTIWPSLTASERAYCRSPSSALTSLETRFE
jgi:hypothetical protein